MSPFNQAKPPFLPAMRFIGDIALTNPISITTTVPHLYGSGILARLIVPAVYGTWQANNLQQAITVTSATTFTMPIDATQFTPFVTPVAFVPVQAQVVPFGEITEIVTQAERNVLPYP